MLLVDTNVWLSAADVRSERHDDSVALLSEHRGELATTVPVIPESSWLILDRLGPEAQARFLDLVISRTLDLVDLTHQDWERVAALCRQYADLRLDATDASLIAVAERMRLGSIATYNHRDFLVVRPEHVATFELLP